jgi:hypothetical protein
MTCSRRAPATHIYRPAKAPVSFKRLLGGRDVGIHSTESHRPPGVHHEGEHVARHHAPFPTRPNPEHSCTTDRPRGTPLPAGWSVALTTASD